jgi:hypothetical protein
MSNDRFDFHRTPEGACCADVGKLATLREAVREEAAAYSAYLKSCLDGENTTPAFTEWNRQSAHMRSLVAHEDRT